MQEDTVAKPLGSTFHFVISGAMMAAPHVAPYMISGRNNTHSSRLMSAGRSLNYAV